MKDYSTATLKCHGLANWPMSKNIWIIAGEQSGDAYGALLAKALRGLDAQVTIRGMGGEAMAQAGVDVMVDSTELGVVGFVEVLRHLRLFWRIFHDLLDRAAQERPDAVILIDYPGFNLRFARRLHALGIRVVYYVSPQVWAWGKRRIPTIARCVDKMLVIFPFEPQVYAETGLDVEFVGHPLLEVLDACRDPALTREPSTVLLLPGSRGSEIERLLPVMLDTVQMLHAQRPELQFVIAVPREAIADRVRETAGALLSPRPGKPAITLAVGETRRWLQRAGVGLAASGTVTVESAILGLPLVVIYRVHPFTYWLGRLLVKIPFFTMVNLVAGKAVYEEFLQNAVAPPALTRALTDILPGGKRRDSVRQEMAAAVQKLGGQSPVCERAAEAVFELIESEAQ